MILPFIGPSYTSQSSLVDCDEAINCYLERQEWPGAKVPYALYPTPGFTALVTLPQSPIRGMFSQDDRCFVVAGAKLYEISATFVATELGTVAVDQYPATLCSNGSGGHQLFVTSGNVGYIYDLVSGVFTASVVTGCRMGGFVDGYFVVLDATTSTFKLSALEDGTTWDPLDVAQRSTSGDKWIAMIVASGDLWLCGSQTTDVWQDTGAAAFPFEPIAGARIQYGIAAPFSLVVVDGVPHWLGSNQNGSVVWYRAEGYSVVRCSTHAVEFAIQGYSSVADAVGFVYQDQGHQFAIMNFVTGGISWAYDATEGQFHKRGYWNSTTGTWEAYRPQYHTFCFGRHLVGDRDSGTIYQMRVTTATEVDGAGIRRLRQVPLYADTMGWIRHSRLDLDLDVGVGLSSGQGSTPQIALSWSDDGGKTFGNELLAGVGAIGAWTTQVFWNRLGQARGTRRVYRVVMTDPVPWRIAQAFLQTSRGHAA